MRPLEILIPVLLAICLLWPLGIGAPPIALRILPSLALLATVIHLIVEKYRWQMVPLYCLSGTIFIASLLGWGGQGLAHPPAWSWAGLAIGFLLLIAATALPVLLPVPRVPDPTGPHKVGTVTRVLVDEGRRELYSVRDEPRRFVIQVWYPALPRAGDRPAPWMPNPRLVARAISRWIRMPRFFLDHLSLSRTHSYENVPLDRSDAPYPLLVFSHGWGGIRSQNTYQTQELASHGYVVVGMEHPHGSAVTLFPDGAVVYNNPAALPFHAPEAEDPVAARKLADQWVGDIGFALDHLASLNVADATGQFTGALDMDKLGVFGHSTGAGAVVQFCGSDPRPKAGFGEDVYMTPVSAEVIEAGVSQPFGLMFSQVWADDKESKNNRLFRQFEERLTAPHTAMHILGTNHYDFTDLPALSPLAHALGLKGPIRGARVQRIVNDYSLAFFDLYLKGKPSQLFEGASPDYPEVVFR
jgi:predicted dienelactone hydrolase